MHDDNKQNLSIIIDNGSKYIKAGLSGEKEEPELVFPTCIGYPKVGSSKNEIYIGSEVEDIKEQLKFNYPIDRGFIKNFYDMEKIWEHIFTNELKVDPVEYNILLTEVQINYKENREKSGQIMFETFNVPKLIFSKQAYLSSMCMGKFSCFVVELGYGLTQFVPFFDCCSIPYRDSWHYYGGGDLTEFMKKMLEQTGYDYCFTKEKETVKKIKEKSCYIPLDFEEELKCVEPFKYEFPDGTNIILKDERKNKMSRSFISTFFY